MAQLQEERKTPEQIKTELAGGLDPYHAIIEATVRRSRPVLLTALAAVLAFAPLTLSSFWGPLAFVLIGGTAVGTVLTLLVLPALYALWFGVADPAGPAPARKAFAFPRFGRARQRLA